jgi:hypothetical protein
MVKTMVMVAITWGAVSFVSVVFFCVLLIRHVRREAARRHFGH